MKSARAQVEIRHAAWVCELAQEALDDARYRDSPAAILASHRLFRAIYGLEDVPPEYPDRIADVMDNFEARMEEIVR